MPDYRSRDDTLQYDERGEGDPVVVIGGGPARDPDYLGDLGGLGEAFRLVVPHLRGTGGSPFPADAARASWWEQAEDVEALREHLHLGRITVLGHSAGSALALAFAVRFPGSLARLVLVGPPAAAIVDVTDDLPAIRARRADEPAYAAALATAQQGPPTDGVDDRLTAWQQSIAPISYARWQAPQQEHSRLGGWTARAVQAYEGVPAPESFGTDLAAVAVPVTVLAGREDGVVGLAGPTALAELVVDGVAVPLADVGHYPWIDDPAGFTAAASTALVR